MAPRPTAGHNRSAAPLRRPPTWALAAKLAVTQTLTLVVAAGCGSDDSGSSLTVFAASSLTEAFAEMAGAFEARHPDTLVVLNFAGTPTLRTQLEQGAHADVFASADAVQMALATRSGVIEGSAVRFATNRLVIVAPVTRPAVRDLGDLQRPGIKLVLGLSTVPAGAYARRSIELMADGRADATGFATRVLANVVSEEANVRQVVAKVALGEADAGIAYASDVTADVADALVVIDIPQGLNVPAAYLIAKVARASNRPAATLFVALVLSAHGQQVLADHGFGLAAP